LAVQLADALDDVLNRNGVPCRLRTATVDAWAASRATITLAGATVADVPCLDSYTPGIGHVVLLLQSGSQLLIIGRAH
jgi:hypothetical protein